MITTAQIREIIEETLQEKECFVVQLDVLEGNKISLEIDSLNGIVVADCVAFNKAIESKLDREVEDFELLVSSPGLDKPFRVVDQYYKNIGREVKVVRIEGEVIKGELTKVEEEAITVTFSYKERIEGRKKKQTIVKEERIPFNNIKETTIIISFKK